jgi:hypothetical protein
MSSATVCGIKIIGLRVDHHGGAPAWGERAPNRMI